MRRTTIAISVLALVGGLAACGGGSKGEAKPTPTYTRAQYVDELMKDFSPEELPITTAQARCFSGKSIDAFGLAEIRQRGYTPKSLRKVPDVKALSKKFGGQAALDRLRATVLDEQCFKVADVLEGVFAGALPKTVTDAQVQCLAGRVATDPAVRTSVADLLAGGDWSEQRFGNELDAAVPSAAAACNVPLDASAS